MVSIRIDPRLKAFHAFSQFLSGHSPWRHTSKNEPKFYPDWDQASYGTFGGPSLAHCILHTQKPSEYINVMYEMIFIKFHVNRAKIEQDI